MSLIISSSEWADFDWLDLDFEQPQDPAAVTLRHGYIISPIRNLENAVPRKYRQLVPILGYISHDSILVNTIMSIPPLFKSTSPSICNEDHYAQRPRP